MADFLLSVGVDVGLSYDQMQKDISDLVTQLNQNPQRVRVGLEIDHSAIERFRTEVANIHNSMGGLGRVTVSPVDTGGLNNAIDGIARLAQSTQGAISTVQTMRAELNSVNAERIQQAIASINGISAEGASALAHSLGEANVRATEVRARLLEAADAEQQLVALQVRGTNEAGHMVNYLMTYNTETGEISRRMVDITARLEDATAAESHRATTVREITDLYRQMHALMRTNANAANTASYAELANQAQLLQDALALARTESISVDEALTRLGTSGATAIGGARDAMSAFRLEMEQTGSSGSVSLTTMYNTVAQMQTLLNNNAGYANLGTYTNLQTQVNLLAQAIELASNGGMTLEAALNAVGLNGSTAIHNAREAMSAFKAEMSGATAEEERLTIGTANYRTALERINTLLRQVRANTEKWTAAKTGKSSADYQVYADQARELENLAQRLSTGTITMREFNAEYGRIKSTASGAETAIRASSEATQTWSQRLSGLTAKFGTWFSITRVIMATYRAVREMVSAVIDLDTAMTELKKVTNETDATYEKSLVNATKRAKTLGAELADTVSATADFARLGFGIADAEKLADAAIVYKNVGDGIDDIGTASERIIATMQAFSIPAEEVMKIVDKFNEVGNNYAISSKGVGDALLRSAAAMNAANNSLDETIALAAAANTIVQDPEKVGTTLKTVSMYLRAAKTEAEEAGESTEGMADSVSELRDEILRLTGNKVDIQIDEDTFKSTYQILQELSQVWGELSDISQANILEMVGGKRNSNVVAALLENFTVAENAMKTSAESAGSALAENEKVLESIQGELNIMKAEFPTFAQNFIGSGLVKFVVDFATGILSVLNGISNVIEALGGFKTVLMAVVSALLIAKGGLIAYKIQLIAVAAVKKIITFCAALKNGIVNIIQIIPNAITAWKAYAAGTVSASTAMQASIPVIGLVLAALTALTAGIAMCSSETDDTAEDAQAQIDETNQKMRSLADTASDYSNELINLSLSYMGASDALDTLSGSVDAYISARDGLIKGLDIEKSKLDELIEKYGDYDKALANASLTKLQDAEVDLRLGVQNSELSDSAFLDKLESQEISINGNEDLFNKTKEAINIMIDAVGEEIINDWFGYTHNSETGLVSKLYMFTPNNAPPQEYTDMYGDAGKYVYAYESYKQMLQALQDAGIDTNDQVYKAVAAQYSSISTEVEAYLQRVAALNENLAQQYVLQQSITDGLPTTQAEFDTFRQKIIDAAVASGEFTGDATAVADAVDNVLGSQSNFSAFYEIEEGKAKLSDLAEVVSKLKSNYDLLATAQKEMADGDGGLSASTIQALADETDRYLDYLYEENGVIKLNTEAWKAYANEKMLGDISSIKDEIEALRDKREEIMNSSDALYKEVEAILAVGEAYNALTNGNVDYNKRPLISPEKMREVYPEFDGEIATTYSSGHTIGEGEALYTIEVTPILEDGTVLSEDALVEYINNLITTDGVEGVLASDTSNLILNIQPGDYDEEYWNNYQEQIGAVKNKHWELIQQLQENTGLSWGEIVEKYTEISALLGENTSAIEANQDKLGVYEGLYNGVTNSLNAYSEALAGFTEVSNKITSVSDSLTTVADLQETVANGFTISLEKALEFAKVYPEILNGATVAADGQISLNEGIVNAFIEGKEAELKAQIDAEVAKLEADKAVLTAKMEFSKAQLELAKSVGTGEGQISKEVAEYRVNAGNAVAQALIAAGIDEATAYQLACAAMAQNSEEFNRVAAEVCTDVQGNFNQAAYDAAQAIYTNMQNSKMSIASVASQAHEAAKAIAGIASGTVQGSSSVQGGGAGGSYTGKGNISVHSGSFKGTKYTYEAKTISLEDFISDLELDISNYQQAISQIDGQIATLKALRNTSLNKFSTSNKNAGKGSGSGGSNSKDNEPTWFEKEYALHQHLLKMDTENVDDYLDWLNSAYQRAYKEGIIDLDDYYKYQEEVYTGLQDLFKDYLNDVEHEISMRENYEGESDKIIELYKKLMKDVEKEIAAARAQGLDDTDDYIQELQKKWQGYAESVKDIQEDATESAKDAVAELVDYRIDMIKQDIENEKDALDKKLDYLKEFYDKQKDMLQDQYDEEQYLKEQAEKRKSVSDLRSEIAMLENDDSAWAQKRKLELQEELATAEDDLGTFEDEHALDLALDALDNAYNAQEAQIQAEMDALEEKLNDPEALYNQALTEIKNNTGNLYQEMLEYNRKHGTGNDEDVKDIYEEAYKALLEYKDIYGKDYEGVVLTNSTNYKPETGSWDTEKISGTNPDNQKKKETKPKEKTKPKTKTPTLTDAIKRKVAAAIWNGNFGWGTGSTRTSRLNEVFGSNNGIQALVNQGVGKNSGAPGQDYTYLNMRKKFKGYASGTKNAIAGLHSIDELGAEYLFTSEDGSRYRVFSGGEKVLNAKATDFLYEFANGGGEILEKIIKSAFGTSLFDHIQPVVNHNEIDMGDVIVQGSATQQTVSEIRRAQRDNLTEMLKSLNKLNK